MTMQAIPGELLIPPLRHNDTDTISSALSINAAGERAAVIFRVPKTGIISKILWRTAAVNNNVDQMDVALETVNASGDPSGTNYGGSTPGNEAAATLVANTSYATALGAAASTATKGDIVAAVIDFNARTTGDIVVAGVNTAGQYGGSEGNFPYAKVNQGAGFIIKDGCAPILGIEYSDGNYENIYTWPVDALTYEIYNVNTAGADEYALRFQLPVPVRVVGYWAYADINAAADIVLYEGTTVKATNTLDTNKQGPSANIGLRLERFASPVSLLANTEYFLALKPTTTTNCYLRSFDVLSAAVMDSFFGGQAFHMGKRLDSGAWTKVTTTRPRMGIIIDQLDDGAGGGGGLITHPGMSGGMRG